MSQAIFESMKSAVSAADVADLLVRLIRSISMPFMAPNDSEEHPADYYMRVVLPQLIEDCEIPFRDEALGLAEARVCQLVDLSQRPCGGTFLSCLRRMCSALTAKEVGEALLSYHCALDLAGPEYQPDGTGTTIERLLLTDTRTLFPQLLSAQEISVNNQLRVEATAGRYFQAGRRVYERLAAEWMSGHKTVKLFVSDEGLLCAYDPYQLVNLIEDDEEYEVRGVPLEFENCDVAATLQKLNDACRYFARDMSDPNHAWAAEYEALGLDIVVKPALTGDY